MEQEELDLGSLEPIEIKLRIGGKPYVLREADEGTSARYDDAMLKGGKISGEGKLTEIGSLNEARAVLIQGCLFELDGDKRRPLSLSWVKALPKRIADPLFDHAKRVSGMNEAEPEQAAKNEPSATEGT